MKLLAERTRASEEQILVQRRAFKEAQVCVARTMLPEYRQHTSPYSVITWYRYNITHAGGEAVAKGG